MGNAVGPKTLAGLIDLPVNSERARYQRYFEKLQANGLVSHADVMRCGKKRWRVSVRVFHKSDADTLLFKFVTYFNFGDLKRHSYGLFQRWTVRTLKAAVGGAR